MLVLALDSNLILKNPRQRGRGFFNGVKNMTLASCHCQNVQIKIKGPPKYFNQCHCEYCRRFGAIWADYNKKNVAIFIGKDSVKPYSHKNSKVTYYLCNNCGCLAFRRPLDKFNLLVSVNCLLLNELQGLAKSGESS